MSDKKPLFTYYQLNADMLEFRRMITLAAVEMRFFVIGCVLLGCALILAFYAFHLGELTKDQRVILLWLLPLSSGFAAGAFAGSLSASGDVFSGITVAATGGFAVWILTYFLLPKSSDEPLGNGPQSISIPPGWKFKEAAEHIAGNLLVTFIGFTDDELRVPLASKEFEFKLREEGIMHLRHLAPPGAIRDYYVSSESSVFRVSVK